MSSSESSSSSPEPAEVSKSSKKSKDKGKKTSVSIDAGKGTQGKNEGVDPNWDYKPPADVSLLQNTADAGEFDWDAVANNDDLELWLVRVPESVKPRYIENAALELPPTTTKSSRMGTLKRKHATFDIWSVGEDDEHGVGGEEIKALSCLLPRKSKKGILYPAPKPFTRHIVVSAQAVAPTPGPSSTGPIEPHSRPTREIHPKEVLTHRFMPFGSLSGTQNAEEEHQMDVDHDVPATQHETRKKSKRSKPETPVMDTKKAKGKKRKGDGDADAAPTEKKSKKAKTL
ncbi:hypothetical protein D9615_002039 [Tricholomella constricta]|uniref:Uncharacterized protein n=1 Tax=Tricholomella constricta TaxID=117010 RepID=A0A8H5HP80_9AGAR|nr:hypothetical protein D9615_002039 [Tricholomella constricta]